MGSRLLSILRHASSWILLKILFEGVSIQHSRRLTQGFLELQVCLLLDGLSILKSLDELHFQLFHLRDFVHLHVSQRFLLLASLSVLSLGLYLLPSSLLLDLHLREPLRLQTNLILHLILLLDSEIVLSLFLLVLLLDHLRLLSFFFLLQEKSILNLFLFVVPLLGNHVIILAHMPLLLVLQLDIEDFL